MANSFKDITAPSSNLSDVMMLMNKDKDKGNKVQTFLAMRMNQYLDIDLTQEEARKLSRAFQHIEVGNSIGLIAICDREKCLYKDRCPLYESDKCPQGRECLFETFMQGHYLNSYLESLQVDIDNMPEMVLINQLVEYEIIEGRCNAILSTNHVDLMMTQVIGLSKQGDIIEQDMVSYALEVKLKMQKNKKEILESFTATRKERWKKAAALKEVKEGPAKQLADLKARISAVTNREITIEDIPANLNALQDLDMENE